jgi:hypothetical protein
MPDTVPAIAEYEVFKNERNALAFFFFRHPSLDQNPTEGPFWFTFRDGGIIAGTEEHHVLFESVKPDILDIARRRGVIMLMEFEQQQPVRCTPCYLSQQL